MSPGVNTHFNNASSVFTCRLEVVYLPHDRTCIQVLLFSTVVQPVSSCGASMATMPNVQPVKAMARWGSFFRRGELPTLSVVEGLFREHLCAWLFRQA